ncbi:hypothetical protein BJV77DRAFT_965965 [Russula vinacea]|nr:hypothetical protein BJV77DRAFT_965965 [Russula vinacea]
MQSLGDLSLNLAGSVKLPYMGNLKKEKSHVIAKPRKLERVDHISFDSSFRMKRSNTIIIPVNPNTPKKRRRKNLVTYGQTLSFTSDTSDTPRSMPTQDENQPYRPLSSPWTLRITQFSDERVFGHQLTIYGKFLLPAKFKLRSTGLSSEISTLGFAERRTYKRKTKKDLASHPLLPSFQFCESSDAVLTVLREQIPAFSQSQNGDDRLTKWVAPTVNVLYSFSATLGGGVGIAFPPANTIFAGIGVFLSAAKDVGASQDKLIELFNRIEHFFLRLEIYSSIKPTAAMMDIIIEIMVEVLTILAIATKEAKRVRLKKYMKKLTGSTEIEDSLSRRGKDGICGAAKGHAQR